MVIVLHAVSRRQERRRRQAQARRRRGDVRHPQVRGAWVVGGGEVVVRRIAVGGGRLVVALGAREDQAVTLSAEVRSGAFRENEWVRLAGATPVVDSVRGSKADAVTKSCSTVTPAPRFVNHCGE